MTRTARLLSVATVLCTAANCSGQPQGPTAVTGSSAKFVVQGQFMPLKIEQVDALKIYQGKLLVQGAPASNQSQSVDIPPEADATKPDPHWALTTETDPGSGSKRSFVFTHDMSLEEFAIDLPSAGADVHYGVLSGKNGGDVMLLAWGEKSRSYWGYLIITPKSSPP